MNLCNVITVAMACRSFAVNGLWTLLDNIYDCVVTVAIVW
jgi:hypothetical protein